MSDNETAGPSLGEGACLVLLCQLNESDASSAEIDIDLPKATVAKVSSAALLKCTSSLRCSVAHQRYVFFLIKVISQLMLIAQEYLPVGLTCAKDARDLVGDACKGTFSEQRQSSISLLRT